MCNNPFQPLHECVYDQILNDIVKLKYPPGFKLRESDLASHFKVSRTPVKMALDKLCERDLVTKKQRTYFVSSLDALDYDFLCDARVMIEGEAAFYAAKNASESNLLEIKENIDAYFKVFQTSEFEEYALISHSFHTLVVKSSGNPYLVNMYKDLQFKVLRFRYYVHHKLGAQGMSKVIGNDPKSHQTIYNAIRLGYSDIAKSEMESNVNQMKKFFLTF